MIFSRVHKYSNKDTHLCKPIGDFLRKYSSGKDVVVDPFARNCEIGNYTNDLNPSTKAKWHMQAIEFLEMLERDGVKADVIILDPPYSPRQISDLYKEIGLKTNAQTTQNAPLYAKVKKLSDKIIKRGGVVINLGWNSMGMGKKNGYEIEEIMLVCHGGAQNDTICLAERKL